MTKLVGARQEHVQSVVASECLASAPQHVHRGRACAVVHRQPLLLNGPCHSVVTNIRRMSLVNVPGSFRPARDMCIALCTYVCMNTHIAESTRTLCTAVLTVQASCQCIAAPSSCRCTCSHSAARLCDHANHTLLLVASTCGCNSNSCIHMHV